MCVKQCVCVCVTLFLLFCEVEAFLESLRFPVESKVHQPLTLDQKMQGLTDEQASDKSNLAVSFTLKLDVCTATNAAQCVKPKWTWNWKLSWGGCIYCLTHCVICPFPYLQYERWNVGCARHAQLWQSHQLFTRHESVFSKHQPLHRSTLLIPFPVFGRTPGTHHERWRKSASTWQFQSFLIFQQTHCWLNGLVVWSCSYLHVWFAGVLLSNWPAFISFKLPQCALNGCKYISAL